MSALRRVAAVAAALAVFTGCSLRGGTEHSNTLTSLTPLQADTLIVRAILDTNGLRQVPVGAVTQVAHGRVVGLYFGRGRPCISRLPGYVASLSRLYELVITDCGLYTLPHEVDYLQDLYLLRLDNNRLTNIPEQVGDLVGLKELSIRRNQLVEVPAAIGQLFRLERLDLSRNRIQRLSDSVGHLSRLRALDLSHNRLTSMPAAIGGMDSLLTLKLDYNDIAELPAETGRLSSLRILSVSNNRLIGFPKEVGGLTRLNVLQASYNRIEQLPSSLGSLSGLMVLDLRRNDIAGLPSEVAAPGGLSSLYQVRIEHNRLCGLPMSTSRWLERIAGNWRDSQRCHALGDDDGERRLQVLLGDTVEVADQRVAFLAVGGDDDDPELLVRVNDHVGVYKPRERIGESPLGIRLGTLREESDRLSLDVVTPTRCVVEPDPQGHYALVGPGSRATTLEAGAVELVGVSGGRATFSFLNAAERELSAGEESLISWENFRATVRCTWVFGDGRGPAPEFYPDSAPPVMAAGIVITTSETAYRPDARLRESLIAADPVAQVYIYDLGGRLLASAAYARGEELVASMPNGSYIREARGGGQVVWDRFIVNR